ncbi:hypothetical protein [Novosphingobium soli]|uniref:ABC transporter permease n=1 Tax=Novosphingobium soli TaxID=574956 RepID=A0ABV6D181_9SPHN
MHLPHHSQFAAALQQPRRRPVSTSSPFGAWRDLWRCTPATVRRDTMAGLLLVPTLVIGFAVAWGLLP